MSLPAKRLEDRIRSGGPVPFAEVMSEALYGESGYYRREESPIGPEKDYITGSSLSPMFGRATAQVLRRLDGCLGRESDFLEVGCGDGRHLAALLTGLPQGSGHRVMACDRVARELPAGVVRLESLSAADRRSIGGLIFSYELFDALPVHRLIGLSNGGLGELWVDWNPSAGFHYVEGALSDSELEACELDLEAGQIADVAPGWAPLYRQMAGLLKQGLLVTCDYGFERPRLFDRRVRFHGTLACFRQQRVHRDALSGLGSQDLTAHVDFTTLRQAGEESGLETVAFTRQARWLLAAGLFDQLREADQAGRLEAMDLLDPEGMGEEIRVLIQARGIDAAEVLDLELLGG